MARELRSQTNLETLRKEAKRWRKAILAGEAEAIARFGAGAAAPSLRAVQHALAREYGLPSWAALKAELEDRARSAEQRIALFLETSAHRYGVRPGAQDWGGYERDGPARGALAARLLARHPEMARANLHCAVAAGDIDAVRGFLAKDAGAANAPGGADQWPPLLRLAYTRLPTEAAQNNGLAIAELLLDAGADAGARWSDGHNAFTVLTGVMGGGEAGQSAHPQAEPFARLLLARGADPLDGQGLYNTSLGDDDVFWLDLLWSESERRGETARWRGGAAELMGAPLDYLLGNAVPRHPKRAAWLLAHGARADAVNAYTKRPVALHAAVAGEAALVELLVQHGAARPQLSGAEQFLAAAMRADGPALRALAAAHPEYLAGPHALFAAIRAKRADVAALLLDLGVSPDVGDGADFRALHQTTHSRAAEIAALLIARGAEVDAIEQRYQATPLGHAIYQGAEELIAVLAPVSCDIRGLCSCGATERLAALLAQDAALANTASRGELPLFCLPADEDEAEEVAELLLGFGADARAKNGEGLTPAQVARKRGLVAAAQTLEEAARG